MSKEMLELKPCPFCGSPGAICCLEDEPGSAASFWVNCSCGIETRERRTEAEAIALWNTRAATSLHHELVAALEAAEAALEQAQDCIRGETAEDISDEQAREDTISKVRTAMFGAHDVLQKAKQGDK